MPSNQWRAQPSQNYEARNAWGEPYQYTTYRYWITHVENPAEAIAEVTASTALAARTRADLMAAAPELLAALREAEEELSLHMDSAGGDEEDMARLRRIREAIHHAQGGRR